jgi:NAD(P)-dependent dehydrogenase (short-subunit alcohol dehydrogenase family)
MGLACARRLAKRGPVLLAEFDEARLESALDTLRREAIEVEGIRCDVSCESDVRALAEALHQRGPLGSVVHTAGLSPMMAPADRIYDVNLTGTARISEAFRPLAERGSACVCISSMAGHTGERASSPEVDTILDTPLEGDLLVRLEAAGSGLSPGDSGVAYQLSKWGVQRLVRREARAWGGRSARIVSLSPGIIDTPMGQFENERQPIMKEIAENTPLARMGTADEIAAVAAFLCSQDAAYVTGVDWLVDGGATHGFNGAVETGRAMDSPRGL